MVGGHLDDRLGCLNAICVQKLLGLPFDLIDVGVLAHCASGRVYALSSHDELLFRPCFSTSRAPVVRSPGQEKEIILTSTLMIDVGVDAVLSADVGGAPMRRRQYTAPRSMRGFLGQVSRLQKQPRRASNLASSLCSYRASIGW
jgi:hypothetical protein